VFYLIFLVLAGCLLGTVTGLTPGLHVNTVCIMGVALYSRLGLDVIQFAVVMVAMSVTHTFLDFIPAIFLGVPEEETALTILPTHRLLLEGRSLEAVKLTAYGSLIGLASALLLLILAIYLLPIIYFTLRPIVVYIIVSVALILIVREKQRAPEACLIVALAGWLGYIILDMKALSSSQVLFPAFTGLFGLSTILLSFKGKQQFVPQKPYAVIDFDSSMLKSGVSGSLGGIAVGVLPSLSPSQIGVLMSEVYGASLKHFLVSVSAINTSDAIYSMVSLYTIGNPRSGVAVMISKLLQLEWHTFLLFVGVMACTGLVAVVIHMWVGRKAMHLLKKINYRHLSLAVVIFIVSAVTYMSGPLGLFILALSTVIGLLPPQAGVSRTHLMGVLIVPTVLYFLGLA